MSNNTASTIQQNPVTPSLPPVLPETKTLQEQIKQQQPNSPTDYSYIYKYVLPICLFILCLLLLLWYFLYHRRIEPIVQSETNIIPPIGNAKIQVVTVPNT